jgi:hypothetical protein
MHFWCVVSVVTAGVYLATPGFAQRAKGGPPMPAPVPRAVPSQPRGEPGFKQQQAKKQGKMAPLPAPQLQRLMNMTPEQRERALSRLSPEQRQQVEQRLNQFQRQFNRLPAEQQEALQQRYEAFSKLPQERRTAIRQELQQLRSMTPAQRAERLNSDDAKQNFSPEELSILRGVAGAPDP